MTRLDRLPPQALVIACDARKALFLTNAGTAFAPSLETREVLEADDNPPTREQGTDRPGRMPDHTAAGGGTGPRSAMEATDLHALAEDRFAAAVAARLAERHRREPVGALVIAAPSRFLGELRRHLDPALLPVVLAEFPKDLTKHPVPEILEAIFRH